jgi:hypothetical protein
LTVTEQALIDFQRGMEAMAKRAKNYRGGETGMKPGDSLIRPEMVDELCRTVRLEFDFRDPVHVRLQLEAAMRVFVEALMLTQQHGVGIANQRLRLRSMLKNLCDELTIINGKTPAGRRRAAMLNTAS